MAKKIVRGITDVKTITNQDYDTNNVNDLLSDGQYNYIHRKKGKSEEYHNLTDNIKTISSDNTDLLTVTNNNKTNNTATLHPKHDAQKEQVLESTRNTISIHHGTNGTDEKTTVDTNPQKVLEHSNLRGNSDYVKVVHNSGEETTLLNSEKITEKFNSVDSALQSKQNKLTAMGGISITGNNISLTTLDQYSEDLNNLTYNCLVKPTNDAPNLPTGVYGNGIMTVTRIGDVVSQQYHTFNNNLYIRTRYTEAPPGNVPTWTPKWTPWVKVTTTAI